MKMVYEKIASDDRASFRCLEWQGSDFDFPHHCHPEIEITQILASSGELLVGDRFETFSPGDLTMFGPGLPHRYKNWKSGNSHSRVVQFRLNAFGSGFFDLPEFRPIQQLFRRSSRGLRFSDKVRKEGCRFMTQIFKASTGANRIAMLVRLLDTLSQDKGQQQLASHDFMATDDIEQDQRLERILDHIDAKWNDAVSLAEVAKVAGLHPQSLSRYFRKRLGKTFQDYVIELRLSRAARELLVSKRTISEVAFACGFNNLANFNRLFRSRYNLTPRKYRSK